MMNRLWMLLLILALLSCVMKAPVQEMAEARSAISMAQQMSVNHVASDIYLQKAKQALQQATEAIEQKKYDRARMKAKEAKRQAQQAARVSQ